MTIGKSNIPDVCKPAAQLLGERTQRMQDALNLRQPDRISEGIGGYDEGVWRLFLIKEMIRDS